MSTLESKIEVGGGPARSVLEPPAGRTRSQSARGLAQSKTGRSFVASLVFLVPGLIAHTQSYSIAWHTIDGGGGTSTGGAFAVHGTLGQPDASAPLSNGPYSVTGGFWSLPLAGPTAGTPTLIIVPFGGGQAHLSWMPNTTGFVLQETLSLSPANWVNSPSGAANPVTVPTTLSTKFYRLHKP